MNALGLVVTQATLPVQQSIADVKKRCSNMYLLSVNASRVPQRIVDMRRPLHSLVHAAGRRARGLQCSVEAGVRDARGSLHSRRRRTAGQQAQAPRSLPQQCPRTRRHACERERERERLSLAVASTRTSDGRKAAPVVAPVLRFTDTRNSSGLSSPIDMMV